jgi:microcystin-dependent protein
MSEPFVGEIKMFAGSFAPRGFALCDGQLLAVSQNDALFSLFGTIYGGDGKSTFGLPDLRGRIPLHQGRGPGLSDRGLGSKGGAEKETLTLNQVPVHAHRGQASENAATATTLSGNVLARINVVDEDRFYVEPGGIQNPLVRGTVANAGGSQSHSNLMPTLCINFIVALVGIYPSRH